jgi:hypothetical protein
MPLKAKHYFHWSENGAGPGEAIFVVGNPGRTGRLVTAEMLEFDRDHRAPFLVQLLTDAKEALANVIREHPETAGDNFDQYFGIVNSQEAYSGRLIGLRDDELIARRRAFDERSRAAIRKDAGLVKEFGSLWDDIGEIVAKRREHAPDLSAMRTNGLVISAHVSRAAAISTWIEEMAQPETERATMYQGKSADLLRRQLVHPLGEAAQIDRMTLEHQLRLMRNLLGVDDELMLNTLRGDEPGSAAQRMLASTMLNDSVAIEALLASRKLDDCRDPFIRLALVMLDRGSRAAADDAPLSVELQSKSRMLGKAQYAVYGNSIPPDATFTLRISDGIVRGYAYNGTVAPAYTTFYGMLDRYHSFGDSKQAWDAMMDGNAWDLPPRWKNPPASFDLATPMNFVSTCDIIGGNSGSPVINRKKEIVGLAFDGNIESLPGEFIFAPDKGNRTISVHSKGILESLRHVYQAQRIVNEIESSR